MTTAAPLSESIVRQFKVLALCSVLTAASIAGAWLLLDASGLPMQGKRVTTASAPQASGQLVTCPLEAAAAMAGSKDGKLPFQPDVPGLMATDIASFIVIGRDAAASNRPRDAEVAFLMACRLADKLKGAASVESADGKYLLGAHYAKLALDLGAAGAAGAASRPELLKRAEFLYLDSLRIYSTAYGQSAEKSRSAADGLAAVRRTLALAAAVQPAPPGQALQTTGAVATVAANPVREAQPASSRMTAPNSPVPRAEAPKVALSASDEPQEPRPGMLADASFDCSRARSTSEKMICSDAELFQLNHQVAQVYARVSNVSPDRAALRRQNDVEARRRESICRDRGCLLRWYAYRRIQLVNEMERRTQLPTRAWR